MDGSVNFDRLLFINNAAFKKQLEQDEHLLLSSEVIKYNHVNKKQTRHLVITNKYLYNVSPPGILSSIFSKITNSSLINRKISH